MERTESGGFVVNCVRFEPFQNWEDEWERAECSVRVKAPFLP